jgi:glycerate 2-kinase
MTTSAWLRAEIEQCFRAALHAVDAEPLTRDAVRRAPEFRQPTGRILILAAGKAAAAMARGAVSALDDVAPTGIVIVPDEAMTGPAGLRTLAGSHPLPDARSVEAARAAQSLARDATEGDALLVLLSGGASSLLALPHSTVPVADYAEVVRLLMHAGADIHAINIVRRSIDLLKGGGLAAEAHPARVIGLIISDVIGDDPATIASGPLHADPTTAADALDVLRRYDVLHDVPVTVRDFLSMIDDGTAPSPRLLQADPSHVRHEVIATNRTAVHAAADAARALGYDVQVDAEPLQGEAAVVGRAWGRRAREAAAADAPTAFIAGGETTVTVRGPGRGGRNQEVALAAAMEMDAIVGVAFGALATDGVDGPTDAAGAVVDGQTVGRIREAGIDAGAALADNNAYATLDRAGALVRTGATGTNVMDLCILLAGRAPPTAS